ncbi:MAG TPA: hypothetical protein VNJ08_01430 [Bacteriovoracaceae bacterium]|nr:hypothetical protein [Bacteriovoracaceae bacterium]
MKKIMCICLLAGITLVPSHVFAEKERYNKGDLALHQDLKSCIKDVVHFFAPKKDLTGFLEQSCFELRKSTVDYDVDIDYVKADREACDCLGKQDFNQAFIANMGGHDKDHFFLDLLASNAKEKQQRFQNMMDGMTVQSWLISGDKKLTTTYMQALEKEEKVKKQLDDHLKAAKNTTQQYAAEHLSNSEAKIKLNQRRLASIDEILKGPQELSNPYPSTTISMPNCFSMQSFMTHQQLPTDKAFYKDLSLQTEFDPAEWSLQSLSDNYDGDFIQFDETIRKKEPTNTPEFKELEKRIASRKAKIVFLKKNPLYANLFGASSEDKVKSASILAQQKELFKIIKKSFPVKDNCADTDGACLKHFQSKAYEKDVKNLFEKEEVIGFAREQSQKMLELEYADVESMTDTRLPRSQKAMEEKFRTITGGRSISNCSNSDKNYKMSECVENFAYYCPLLNAARKPSSEDDVEKNTNFISPSRNLEREMAFDFSLNEKENTAFKKLSAELCQTPRVSKTSPNDKTTFHDFVKSYCNGNQNKEECSTPETRLTTFLGKYDPPTSGYVGTADDSKAAILRGESFAATLNTHINKPAPTAEEVQTFRKQASSNTELKRNGVKKFLASLSDPSASAGAIAPAAAATAPAAGDSLFDKLVNGAAKAVASAAIEPSSYAYGPAAAPVSAANLSMPAARKLNDDSREEYNEANEKLMEARRLQAEAKASKDKSAMREMENRVKYLEDMLALKDKAAAKAQKIFDEKVAEEEREKTDSKVATVKPVKASEVKQEISPELDSTISRGPASEPALSPVTQSTVSNKASGNPTNAKTGVAKVPSAETTLNSALLAKYGISVNGPTDAPILLADNKDPKSLKLLVKDQDGANIPLVVSSEDYARFKGNELESLAAAYAEKLQALSGTILKLSVTTKGEKNALEFYAIRDGDKVVIQPVRKHTLADLKKEAATKK